MTMWSYILIVFVFLHLMTALYGAGLLLIDNVVGVASREQLIIDWWAMSGMFWVFGSVAAWGDVFTHIFPEANGLWGGVAAVLTQILWELAYEDRAKKTN